MARKPVLDGGKRDEIISAATELFFENGYEQTSVRMILDRVGGEVGMFYHYFKSKEELFQKAVDRFFFNYGANFSQLTEQCQSPEQFLHAVLEQFSAGMESYGRVSDNMHWTIKYALTARTVESMIPAIEKMLAKWDCGASLPPDIAAGRLLFAVSATLHAESFKAMTEQEKYAALEDCVKRLMDF